MKLTHLCPKCKKPAEIKAERKIGSFVQYTYLCGHIELRTTFSSVQLQNENLPPKVDSAQAFTSDSEIPTYETFVVAPKYFSYFTKKRIELLGEGFGSVDGTQCAYDFQVDGVKHCEKAGFNALIADAMGLGKTIQGIVTVKRNPKLLPCLVVVQSSTLLQWTQKVREWYKDTLLAVMPIMDRVMIVPGFDFYIISRDLLAKKDVQEKLKKINIQCMLIDEVQGMKDPSSERTKGLITFITEANIQYKIALSGTPIKNRASEYFTILNLLAPEYFTSMKAFCNKWLVPNDKGVYTRIADWKIEEFRELTKRWIIRREKRDVLKSLPKFSRDFKFITITDPLIKKSYNATLDLFDNFMNGAQKLNSTEILGWLAKLRHITGLAKVPFAIEYIEEFLNSTEDSLTIGFHHNGVRDSLFGALDIKGYSPLKISGEDDAWVKDRVKNAYIGRKSRILLLQMLSGGVGLDGIQKVCSNQLILERCWSSADEEQFESRIDRDGQENPSHADYLTAEGTIDHWFHDIVAEKRDISNETLSEGKLDITQDENVSQMLKDLAEQTLNGRLR